MSSTDYSTVQRSDRSAYRSAGNGWCTKGNWTPFNIAATVISFLVFWPLGLFLVYWVCTGRDVRELTSKVSNMIHSFRGMGSSNGGTPVIKNRVFHEYQQTQYDRIREIKEEIKDQAKRFHAFQEERKRKEDQDEFNSFMAASPMRND